MSDTSSFSATSRPELIIQLNLPIIQKKISIINPIIQTFFTYYSPIIQVILIYNSIFFLDPPFPVTVKGSSGNSSILWRGLTVLGSVDPSPRALRLHAGKFRACRRPQNV